MQHFLYTRRHLYKRWKSSDVKHHGRHKNYMPLSYLNTKKMRFICDYVYHPLFSVLDKYKKEKTILSYINYRGLQLEATTVNQLLLFQKTVEIGIMKTLWSNYNHAERHTNEIYHNIYIKDKCRISRYISSSFLWLRQIFHDTHAWWAVSASKMVPTKE